MLVGDHSSGNISLNEAVHDDVLAEHHAMMGLPSDEEEQAAVDSIGIGGIKEVGSDEYLLSLRTTEDRFQTRSDHWNLIIDGIHLEKDPWSGP